MIEKMVEIVPYVPAYKEQVVGVWEKSVLATHHFLAPGDFHKIRELVRELDFAQHNVYCLLDRDRCVGFIGITDKKVEMLFLAPEYFGKGLGRQLMEFAISELGADKVDVNEQNEGALRFYEKLGFVVYERMAKDDQGHDYPILRMRL